MTDLAPDGSPVAFYARLPATGEPELIDALVPRSASILDLGCGPGRIAGPLVALGHHVTGIDDGAGMIAALPPGVEGVVADARTVRLGRRFDAVLLASHLVNAPDDGVAFAATAAAHLEPDGVVIAETYPPGWDATAGVGRETRLGDGRITLLAATVHGDRLEAEVRYGIDDVEWTQTFTARILDEPALRGLLGAAGLSFGRWLDRPGWFVAGPMPRRRCLDAQPRLLRRDRPGQKSIRMTSRRSVGWLTSWKPASAKMLRLPTFNSPHVTSCPGSVSIG